MIVIIIEAGIWLFFWNSLLRIEEKSWADSELVSFSVFHFYLKGEFLLNCRVKYRNQKPVTTVWELKVEAKILKTEGKDRQRGLKMRQNNS